MAPADQNREVDALTSLSSWELLAVLEHGEGIERVAVEIESRDTSVGKSHHFLRRQLALGGVALGVMVTDISSDIPKAKIRPSPFADCGRGLVLVAAESDGWTATWRCSPEGDSGKGYGPSSSAQPAAPSQLMPRPA
ncbi:hypothetical protein [Streptomyces sp. NPDC048106]|uniref:hypothetical protein n=1 Tax=Streptomyces sp. NPDC048106 TaxID=3155750 RepID=UPI0034559B28